MKIVQPIRDRELIVKIGNILKSYNDKYYIMYKIGINSGLRISDILGLKVSDIKADRVSIVEQKTSKTRIFKIGTNARRETLEYITENNLHDNDYIIYSNKKDSNGNIKSISRQQAHDILKKASRELGMEDIGCHSLRKTFGYHSYKKNKDVVILQKIFNHSAPSVTLRYIGIEQDEIDNMIEDLDL